MLELMAAPFVACIILVGMHVYLGMHVIQRKVIFVDLALAQIAALGATIGFLFGFGVHGAGAFLFSLGFAVVGAAIFTLTRVRHERVPQEAIIGIVYVVALAVAILIADRAPEGAEHIKETLVGSILWVRWPTIARTALLFVVIGAFHFVFRERFLQLSFNIDRAYDEKRWVRLWDFLFYVSFAFVITSAVAIAGVLLVFSFLVIPAVVGTLFADRVLPRLAIGWSVGGAACLVGLVASYRLDMPSGPTVVAALGLSLLLAGLLYSARWKASVGVLLAMGVVVSGAVFFAPGKFMHIEHDHEWEAEDRGHSQDRAWVEVARSCSDDEVCLATRMQERDDWPEVIGHRLADADASIREDAAHLAAEIGTPRALDLLAQAAGSETDPLLKLGEAQALARAGDRRGREIAAELLGEDTPALVREEAERMLTDDGK